MSDEECVEKRHPDAEPDKHRSYHRDVVEFIARLFPFTGRSTWMRTFATIMFRYPMYHFAFGDGPKQVLVTGGAHGEEPAGTYAALDLIAHLNRKNKYEDDFTIHIYPCMNPWGYEHCTRENAANQDINRGFTKEIEVEECRLFADQLKKVIGIPEYDFTIDFHEGSRNMLWKNYTLDDNPDGAWLYELCHDHDRRIGRQMVDAVRKSGLPVNTLKKVYDDICHDGLVSYPEDMKSEDYADLTSFDGFLWNNYTRDAFTSEVNMDGSVEDRVRTHHLFFFAALDAIKDRK